VATRTYQLIQITFRDAALNQSQVFEWLSF